MNEAALEAMIEKWEPMGAEVIRTIDSFDDTVERVLKVGYEHYGPSQTKTVKSSYFLYRYFTMGGDDSNILVSVDLSDVDADHVIQYLAERL